MQEYRICSKEIIITDSPQELADVVVSFLIQKMKASSLLPSYNILLHVDPVLERVYARLARSYQKGEISFHKISCFQTDEFALKTEAARNVLNEGDLGSQSSCMKKIFFDEVDAKKNNIFYPAQENIKNPGFYDRFIQQRGGLNVCLCACGNDGRIGFNQIGSAKESVTRMEAVKASTQEEYKNIYGKIIPSETITVGLQTILSAQEIIFVISGKEKSSIATRILKESPSPLLPATFLKEHERIKYIFDKFAAKDVQSLIAFEE